MDNPLNTIAIAYSSAVVISLMLMQNTSNKDEKMLLL